LPKGLIKFKKIAIDIQKNLIKKEIKMLFKQIKLCMILLLSIGLTGLQAQEALPACGGNAYGTGGSSSYSVGQVVYTSNTVTSGSTSQGVQQPFEIFVISGIEEAKDITLQCSTYPNPASTYLILKFEGATKTQGMASLYDSTGKLLASKKIESTETNFGMSNLAPAMYFLKIIQDNTLIKTFKIIKK
jgi:hypothetical protein